MSLDILLAKKQVLDKKIAGLRGRMSRCVWRIPNHTVKRGTDIRVEVE